jgi:hypothetical protein
MTKITIFEDANNRRHALDATLYKEFKKSKFWQAGYKHITYTERQLDDRQVKALADAVTKVSKIGMFDLVASGWTLMGDVAFTEKQATVRKKAEKSQSAKLKSWERNMKRMDMLPSAAGTILGKMADQS